MLQEAKRQLQTISIAQIKTILKENAGSQYDKMIINNQSDVQRADYYYSSIEIKKATRNLKLIKFPLFNKIKSDFSIFEGGIDKFGEKTILESDGYLNTFLNIEGAKVSEIPPVDAGDAFKFPFEITNDTIKEHQKPYYLPRYTFQANCNECNGIKYITCKNTECNGKHVWRCNECIGSGEITCSKCSGHGYRKCSSCSGRGTNTKTVYRNSKPYESIEKCGKCSGKGERPCTNCGVKGKVACEKCQAKGEITCNKCYAEQSRYGMIDCPTCYANGTIAQFTYVETFIENSSHSKTLKKGDDFEVDKNIILNHVVHNTNHSLAYKNINGTQSENTDEISEKLIASYEDELGLTKTNFPMILTEDFKYQVIPAVKIAYKHMLTNEIHQLTIVDLWDNPEILFHTEAEKLKVNISSISKTMGGVFSKVFKTKGFHKKEDKKTEIKLMIYLAKSDGKIEEQEKEYLSEQITDLKEFTNSEKKELFELMNSEELPDLTAKVVSFSDPEKGREVIENLRQLAQADGEIEESERAFIDKINGLLNIN